MMTVEKRAAAMAACWVVMKAGPLVALMVAQRADYWAVDSAVQLAAL